jgi:hypothetical protein
VDRERVLHAERQRGRIHHAQAALDRLQVRERGQEGGVGILVRVAVVDAPRAALRHQDRLRADLERAQGGRRVGGEERVARPCGEDHDPTLLEMPDGAPPDVRLRDLRDLERREDARVGAEPLQRVLQRERVQDGREHPRVVGGRAVHPLRRRRDAAVDVAAADDDRKLQPFRLDVDDLARDPVDRARVGAEVVAAHQRLAGELEEDAPEGGSGACRRLLLSFLMNGHAPILKQRGA